MKQIVEAIKKHDNFLITAHINLEGDSLGSQLAMKQLLDSLGKKSFILDSDPIPEHYGFLPGTNKVSNDIAKRPDFDAAIILDCPTLKRTGKVKDVITKDKFIINIDHHVSNEKFGSVNWVDSNASSAGEIVYKLFKEMGVALTKESALCLYIAILTDTGSFNYENTSGATHEIAGELLGYGLEPARVSESVYETKTIDEIKFLGMVLATIKINKAGDVAYLEITRPMMQHTGTAPAKSEGFVNYARSINHVKVAVIFREDPDGKINISFRSKSDVDVNLIASSFGGGGHTKASGCVIEGKLADVEKKVLAKIEEVLGR
ncbi:MAG: bifunctional oligoribonuclease/PAP phosphatase NrnA [Candidatus Omnitrophota bacterium]|jgi:phosphoesterase RecJ-like protein